MPNTIPAHRRRDSRSGAIPSIIPSWAEQGIATASMRVAIILSLLDSSTLVTITAIVPHPIPRTRGITALPLKPTFLNSLSSSMAILGRNPESSSRENARKNIVTIGKTMATAYLSPRVITPYSPPMSSLIQ